MNTNRYEPAKFYPRATYVCGCCNREVIPEFHKGLAEGESTFLHFDGIEGLCYVSRVNEGWPAEFSTYTVTTHTEPNQWPHHGFNYPSSGEIAVTINGREFERMVCTLCGVVSFSSTAEGGFWHMDSNGLLRSNC